MGDLSPHLLLADQAYHAIKRLILAGGVDPGTLLREAEFARQIGMSRTPIREALKRLSSEKILEISPSGGYLVVQFTPSELEEIYALRAALEGLAANLAARKMTRVASALLQDQLDAMESAVEGNDDAKLAELNRAFHATIAQISANRLLQAMLSSIQEVFERYRLTAIANDSRRHASYAEHRQIADALLAEDPALSEARIRAHIQKALELRSYAGEGSRPTQ